MTWIYHRIRNWLTVRNDCPKAIHWLAVAMQVWAIGICLFTFSDGMFIARLRFPNHLGGPDSYALLPQFWYVVLGCTLVPTVACMLKRRWRAGWIGAVLTMTAVLSGCLVLAVPSIRHASKLGYPTLLLHLCWGGIAVTVLFRHRAAFFMRWEEPTEPLRSPFAALTFTNLRGVIKRASEIFGQVIYVSSGIIAIVMVIAVTLSMLDVQKVWETPDPTRAFNLYDSITGGQRWRQRLILRYRPLRLFLVCRCLCSSSNDYLWLAIKKGDLELVKLMEETYAELFKYSDPSYLRKFREQGLCHALATEQPVIINYYLNMDVDKGPPPVSYYSMATAVGTGNLDLVKRLMARGHRLDAKAPGSRCNLLYSTIYDNHEEMSRWLITNGVNPQEPNAYGSTVLRTAVSRDKLGMANLFVVYGCDPSERNLKGETLFHDYAMTFHYESDVNRMQKMAWLLDHGVDPEVADNVGKRPIDHIDKQYKNLWNWLLGRYSDPKFPRYFKTLECHIECGRECSHIEDTFFIEPTTGSLDPETFQEVLEALRCFFPVHGHIAENENGD